VEERNSQLFQMRAVFSQASRVMAWLSEADLGFWTMFELFNKLEKEQVFDADGRVMARRRTRTTDAIWLRISMETMARLAGLPWWRRVWVFQEVIVAKELTIFCGVAELSYSAVATAAWLATVMLINIGQNSSWFSHIIRMWVLRQEYLIKQQLSLVDLLSTVRGPSFGVTDPKDRVLALLGLAREQREISRAYQPDYKQSLEEVFCDITRMAINISGSTKVLSYAGSGPSQLPSWSPDWRIGSCRSDYNKLHSTLDSITGVLFRASARSKAIVCGGTPTEILKLQGVVFDAVECCRPGQSLSSAWRFCKKQQGKHTGPRSSESSYIAHLSAEDGSSWLTEAISQDERVEASSRVVRSCDLASQDPMLAILLALQDICFGGSRPRRMNTHILRSLRASFSKRSHEYDRFCDEIRYYNGRLLEDGILSNSNCEFQLLNSHRDDNTKVGEKEISSIYDAARDKIGNLIIGYTTKGYFMSSSSCNVIEGDIICILLGGSVPYVLRRKDDHYILIGEVYIHGIMDGEVLEAVSRQEHQLEWISLK